jgi:hypothetical protein
MSKLLLDSQPLLVIPELATLIGLSGSIVLQQVHYWVEINRKAKRNFKEGHFWTFNSYETWQAQFPFWSLKTVKRVFTRLEAAGLLVSDNFNRIKFDRTKWYRIDHEALERCIEKPKGQLDPLNEDSFTPPIPEINQGAMNDLGALTAMGELLKVNGKRTRH